MKILIVAGMAALIAVSGAQAQTAATSPTKSLTTCEALTADWRRVEQNMADRFVEALGDNSAPRATMREMREANDLAIAAMTLQFMRDNKCPLPKRAPNTGTYLTAALECSKARREAGATTSPPACQRENWIAQ